jgi:hypothetical protein
MRQEPVRVERRPVIVGAVCIDKDGVMNFAGLMEQVGDLLDAILCHVCGPFSGRIGALPITIPSCLAVAAWLSASASDSAPASPMKSMRNDRAQLAQRRVKQELLLERARSSKMRITGV